MGTLETNVKKYITSLLIATPVVVTISQLNVDYKNTIGEPIPYQKLGYNSLEHLLRSIPDTVQVRGVGPTAEVTPVVSEKSAHVNELVTHQRVAVPKKKKCYLSTKKRTRTFCPPGYNTNGPTNAYIRPQYQLPSAPRKMFYPVKKDEPSTSTYYSQPPTVKITPRFPINKPYFMNSTNTSITTTTSSNQKEPIFEKYAARPAAKPTAVSTPITSKVKRFNSQLDRTTVEQVEDTVPIQIRNNLRALIRQCPEGIWCAEVPEKYRHMFRQELNYQELGFKSLIHLCVSLSSIFHYVRPSTEDYKLYDRSQPLPDCAEKTYTMASYSTTKNKCSSDMDSMSALPNIDWIDIKKFLPGDIFMPGNEIPRTFVSVDAKENDNIDVVIGEIYDLSKFWIYMDDSKLDRLMDDMQEFYKYHAQEYYIPNHLIKEGVYCVQIIFGEYHRALIVDRMPELEDTVRVIFIDYGTMTKVSTKGLCFLHTDFSKLEAQAIRCRLANVFPLEEGAPWNREACKAFRQLVLDRDISAKISHINWDEQYLEVFLADVTNEDDIFYINDRLVEEGFAQQPDKERKQSILDPIYVPIVKYLHLFPTFLELEHGLAPSTAEMEAFQECNLPINFCYPQYFYIDHSEEEKVVKAAEEFHEKNIIKGKRRTPFSHHMDVDKYKTAELDFSIFGTLQNEIKEFLNSTSAEDKKSNNTEEEFADADEDFIDADEDFIYADEDLIKEKENCGGGLETMMERLEVNERSTDAVDVLKKDLMVTEDIIKDIMSESEPFSSVSPLEMKFSLSEQCPGDFNDFNYKEECVSPQSETVKNTELNNLSDSEIQEEVVNHPLSMMRFSEDCSKEDKNDCDEEWVKWREEKDTIFDLEVPNVHLNDIKFTFLPEDNPLSIINRLKADADNKINDFLNDELYLDVPAVTKNEDIQETPAENIEINTAKHVNTNPFLEDVTDFNNTKDEIITLNPNNPFLTYHQMKSNPPSSEESARSSPSTVYESPAITQPQHSWSSFSDMSPDTISQLGRSLCGNSSSSGSQINFDDKRSCSTQTSEKRSVAVQALSNEDRCNYVLPVPVNMYPPWSVGYSPNPYYSVRYANFQTVMYESQFNPRGRYPLPSAPGLMPPPGFYPPRFASAGYGQSPYRSYGPRVDTPNPQNFCYNGPVNNGISRNESAPFVPSATSTECVNGVPQGRDFYDVYNEKLNGLSAKMASE